MTRVATNANFQSALLDLQRAQARGVDAQNRISTQKIATDLAGFGRASETLSALKSMDARLTGFITTGETVAARLETQALAMDRIAEGVLEARTSIANALAAGKLDGLMAELEGHFQTAQGGLNMQHQGAYLFGGGRSTEAPVTVGSLAELAAAPSSDDVFANDQLKSASRLDESTMVTTGFLADEVGGPLMAVFRALQDYHTGPDGPITGAVDGDVRAFLESQLTAFDAAHQTVIQAAARNGSNQNRVDAVLAAHETQQLSLTNLIGSRTDADMAQAVTDLELSQIAIQASAQVINGLRDVSLLNLLSTS